MSGNSKEAYSTLKVLTKTQQHTSPVIKDSSRNILTESTAVLNRKNEYCNGLHNYELHQDTCLLQSNKPPPPTRSESLPVLREAVEEAVRSLKAGKSPGADNIPFELFKNGGETTKTVLTAICQGQEGV